MHSGTWCSGITPAQHAGGPGFNPQCVHVSYALGTSVPSSCNRWVPGSIAQKEDCGASGEVISDSRIKEVARAQSLRLRLHQHTACGDINFRCKIACIVRCCGATTRSIQGAGCVASMLGSANVVFYHIQVPCVCVCVCMCVCVCVCVKSLRRRPLCQELWHHEKKPCPGLGRIAQKEDCGASGEHSFGH